MLNSLCKRPNRLGWPLMTLLLLPGGGTTRAALDTELSGTQAHAKDAPLGNADGPTERSEDLRAALDAADRAHLKSAREAVARYRGAADDEERNKLEAALRVIVAQHFDVHQKRRQLDLEELEAQVQRLRRLHKKREAAKDQIVGDRVSQLLRDAEGLGWGGGRETQTYGSTSGSESQPTTSEASPRGYPSQGGDK